MTQLWSSDSSLINSVPTASNWHSTERFSLIKGQAATHDGPALVLSAEVRVTILGNKKERANALSFDLLDRPLGFVWISRWIPAVSSLKRLH